MGQAKRRNKHEQLHGYSTSGCWRTVRDGWLCQRVAGRDRYSYSVVLKSIAPACPSNYVQLPMITDFKCSKTLAFKLQTPVNHPADKKPLSKHGASLKSRIQDTVSGVSREVLPKLSRIPSSVKYKSVTT
jgi:hypothetical protein